MSARNAAFPLLRPLGLAALLVALGVLGACAPRGAQAPRTKLPTGPAYLFVSPNTEGNLSLDEARRRLSSPGHRRFKVIAADILHQLGVAHPTVRDALGDWSDGVENSLLVEVPGGPTWRLCVTGRSGSDCWRGRRAY